MIIVSRGNEKRTQTLKLLSQEKIAKEREMGEITTIKTRENEKRTESLKEKIAKEREMGKITTTKNTEIPIQADKSMIILSRENEKRRTQIPHLLLQERIAKERD